MNNGEEYGKLVREVFRLAQAVCMGCLDAIDIAPTGEDVNNMIYTRMDLYGILADYFGIRSDEI